jgi:hypothetical protein
MHLCVCELQQPPLHTLPAQQLSTKAPQLAAPLLLPLVELLQELADVPETDPVCPLYVQPRSSFPIPASLFNVSPNLQSRVERAGAM